MTSSDPFRKLLADALTWREAHATFDDAVNDFPPALRGRRVEGFPHSAWELVEHLRRAQHDLLDFCRNPQYEKLRWPDDYWPPEPAPSGDAAWEESVEAYRQDRAGLQEMITNPQRDLLGTIPHGTGQTYLREVLLSLDHSAYHVGQLVALRQMLGAWPGR